MSEPRATIPLAAQAYLASGLSVLPARREGDEKRVALRAWKPYQNRLPTTDEVQAWFSNGHQALCLVCGGVSGNLEMVDFDLGAEAFEPWCRFVREAIPGLLERLVIETTPSGGRHVAYRAQVPVSGNLKLAQRRLPATSGDPIVISDKTYVPRRDTAGNWHVLLTMIETRGEGGLFLCAPSDGYVLVQGDLSALPVITADERETLLSAAWALNEVVPAPEPVPRSADAGTRPGDDYSARGDVRAVLQKHGWTLARPGENEYWRRPGKNAGTSATLKDRVFYVFSSNAAPFEPQKAYSPFSVYALLEHGGDFAKAAAALRAEGYGGGPEVAADVDVSAIVAMAADGDSPPVNPGPPDPGPVPDALLYVPGFIGEIIDFCMANAPYPSLGMAFCGALAMQGHLCGRKVRDPGDLRTNLYLLALASSSAGKNYPRQINSHLAIAANMAETMRARFASGEGIEDRMESQPSTMYQTDEIDGLLQSVSKARDARYESIITTLLTMYSSANMMYPMRSKAGKQAGVIHQPHLTVFGTATPGHYYEALSQRMLTNGFFARMVIVDTGKRAPGQDTAPVDTMPKRLIETACWWADFLPGERRGNLFDFCPQPVVVPYTDDGKRAADDFRRLADEEYARAEEKGDEVATTVWGRANENARKLALLYACSENHTQPTITRNAVDWATAFVGHQTRRMLFMAFQYVAENPFHGECLKFLRRLREAPGQQMPRRDLMRAMRCKSTDFDQVVGTLLQQGDIEPVEIRTRTKPGQGYRLT